MKYRNFRAWLSVLQAAHPGKRLILKAPEHIGGVAELLSAVPEARLIQTHRDPETAFASFVSLISLTQGKVAGGVNAAHRDRTSLRLLAHETHRNLQAREHYSDAIVDVRYDDLVADPLAVVKRIYDHHDVTYSNIARASIERFITENPQNTHGVHRYDTAGLAVGIDEVRSAFAPYSGIFGFTKPTEAGHI